MRENMGLYRGKRKDNGQFIEGFYIFDGFDHYIVKFYTDENAEGTLYPVQESFEVIPETVGQFTGMTDIGGRRIFEGDIMKTAVSGITHHTGAVLYQDGAFGLRCTDESASAFFLCFVAGYYTVIGNIHDTPVLTKEVTP